MKLLINSRVFVAVLAATCLTVVLLTVVPTRSGTPTPGPGQYDPWLDWNDDGKINLIDIFRAELAFGTSGQNISKAGISYDSGWMNMTDKRGQSITVTHNLNIADWNDPNIIVDITGKTTPTSQLLRFLGLTGPQEWSKTYGGPNVDATDALVKTSDGGYAVVGYTASFGAGSRDAWLVKTDWAGNELWNQTYGGPNDDFACALVQTSDGGYALAGYTKSFGAGGLDFWLVKTDASGIVQWNRTYGGTGADVAYALVQTSDGGYALAGYTYSFGAGSADAWLVKTD